MHKVPAVAFTTVPSYLVRFYVLTCLFFIAGKVGEKHGVYSQLTSNPTDVAAPLVTLARRDAFLSSSFLVPQGGSACLKVVCLHELTELTVGPRHIVSTQH